MSEAFLVRRGGLAKAFAVIGVTYPEGSICTCTNGAKTLKAKDTSGSVLFMIPETGTWTVTITDGAKSASKSVVIEKRYQSFSLNIAYGVLYKAGDENEATTGGWAGRAWQINSGYSPVVPSVVRNPKSIVTYTAGGRQSGLFEIQKDVDMTPFSKLKCNIVRIERPDPNYGQICVYKRDSPGAEIAVATLNTGIVTVDVSAISEPLVVGFKMYAYSGAVLIEFSEVTLE